MKLQEGNDVFLNKIISWFGNVDSTDVQMVYSEPTMEVYLVQSNNPNIKGKLIESELYLVRVFMIGDKVEMSIDKKIDVLATSTINLCKEMLCEFNRVVK